MTRFLWRFGGAASLALGAAGCPAFAQDFCGGLSANGQWIGGTEAASDLSTGRTHMEQMALVLQNNEYVALFSVSTPTEARIEAQGRGSGDHQIELRDEGGVVIASDDDLGGNGAARTELTLQPGRYCLSMRSYNGSPMTGFVRVGRREHEPLTTGMDTPSVPQPGDPMAPVTDPAMTGGSCNAGTISAYLSEAPLDAQIGAAPVTATAMVGEVPQWGFTLTQPTALSITAENESADPVITLYDELGSYLAENDDWDGRNARIDMAYRSNPGRTASPCRRYRTLPSRSRSVSRPMTPSLLSAACTNGARPRRRSTAPTR